MCVYLISSTWTFQRESSTIYLQSYLPSFLGDIYIYEVLARTWSKCKPSWSHHRDLWAKLCLPHQVPFAVPNFGSALGDEGEISCPPFNHLSAMIFNWFTMFITSIEANGLFTFSHHLIATFLLSPPCYIVLAGSMPSTLCLPLSDH